MSLYFFNKEVFFERERHNYPWISKVRETVMEIKRDTYLKALTERLHNGMIKVITGIRRCEN